MKKLALLPLFAFLFLSIGCNSGTKPIAVTLSSPTGAQALDLGQSFNLMATVSNDKLNKGAAFTLTGVGTLTNVTATAATYTAPTTGAGGTATVTITSATDPTKSVTLNVVVTAPPSVTTTSLAAVTEGAAYSGTVAVTGGAGTLTYSVSVGSLPAGLSLNSSTGIITGTATGPNGTVSFTVQVKDASTVSPQSTTKALGITVNLPPAPAITTSILPADVEGSAYTQLLAETGGLAPFTYSISAGALPSGLSISSSTGTISGTPTGPNTTASFTVKVADSSNPVQTAMQALSIAINLPAAPNISTTTLPADVEGTAYHQTVAATGFGTLAYSVSVGALPAGLTLNSSTGAITGSPTGPNGTAMFTVKVTDGSNPVQSATAALSIVVNLPPAPAISTTSLPGVVEFATYSQTVAATGYAPLVYSISVGSLPAGVVINSSTGVITGSPTGPNGTASFTVKVTDNSNPPQSITQALSIAVSLPTAPAITTTTLPNGTVGTAYSQTVGLSGGHAPFAWSISSGALPTPLQLNGSTGAITGTPNTQGTANFTVQVVDSSNPAQTATQALSISVVTAPLGVTTATLPTGAVNDVYPATNLVSTGGLPPYTWSITVGALPAGLAISTAGQITGKPTASGSIPFTAQVKDSTNATATGNFSITVNAVLAVTTASLPGGTQGTPYPSTNLNASGGVTPYVWTITSGTLPTGINITGNVLSGIPSVSGTFPITFTVTDASGGTATSTGLSIVLAAAPPLNVTSTSGSLPQGTLNTAYPTTNLTATGGIQPYTWSITSAAGTFPPGMNLSSSGSTAGQITGTPTSGGTFNFTVQVTDATSATASANLSITVNSAPCAGYEHGSESLFKGSYAFLFQGMNGSGTLSPIAAVGSITADGTGKITGGGLDLNQVSGLQQLTVVAAASSYVVGADNRGCMALSFGGNNQVVLHFAVGGISAGVASKGRIIEFDDTTGTGSRGAGILRLQTPSDFVSSHLVARYGFGMDGFDSTNGHASVAGAFNTGGSGTTITNGYADVDDAGTLNSGVSGATGTIGTISSTTGRAAVFFNGSVGATFNLALYVINANEFFIITTDTLTAATPILSGRGTVTGSSFSNSSLSGNYMLHASGSSGGVADSSIGLLTLTSGTVNGTVWDYSTSSTPNASTTTISGGSYSVNAISGRVTITGAGTHAPVLYLTTPTDGISAFAVGTDSAGIFGVFEAQPAGSYSTNSLSGNGGKFFFSTLDPCSNTIKTEVGTVTITPSTGAVNGLSDSSQSTSPFLQTGNVITGTLVINSDGSGNLGASTVLVTNGTKIFFIDEGSSAPAKIVSIEQ